MEASTTRRHRIPLPGSRAVVGGFLVAVAVVGLFAAQALGHGRPSTTYVLIAGPDLLPAGHVLTAGDVRLSAIDLPPAVAGRAHRSAADVVGRVLVANAAPGELVQRSSIAPRGPQPGQLEVSFAVDPARSLGSRIETGDVVDVFLTRGQGGEATTSILLRQVRVIDRQRAGAAGGFTYTVGLPSEEGAQVLLTGLAAGAVSLVRVTSAVGTAR